MAIRTYTVTVSNPGSGNKYYIDGVLQDTLNLAEGYTYVFNYPSGHPFRFSTTSDGTHSGGVEYTTGVTHDSSTQVTIVVASGAPQLYYYCSLHSGMGGTANTVDPSTWGVLTWGQNAWSDQSTVTVSLTGFSVTSSLGTLAYAQSVEGWGRDTWGSNQWGEDAVDVLVTGFAVSGSLGSITATPITIASPTGIEITASLGTPTISRLDMIFDITGPAAMSAGLGVLNINDGADHSQGVGSLLATGSVGALSHEMTYELGSLSATGSVGSPTITSAKLYVITATNLATCSVGSLTIDDMTVLLTGLQVTGSVGSLTVDDMSIGLSGLEMTGALGIISPLHYKTDTITGSTSYTSVDITGSTSYTIDEHAA